MATEAQETGGTMHDRSTLPEIDKVGLQKQQTQRPGAASRKRFVRFVVGIGIALVVVAVAAVLIGVYVSSDGSANSDPSRETQNVGQDTNGTGAENSPTTTLNGSDETDNTKGNGNENDPSDETTAERAFQDELPSSAPSSLDAVADWLASPVTLDDGKMFVIVKEFFHDSDAFTQGLTYANGRLYESTGRRGRSTAREIDPNDGTVLSSVDLNSRFFGEGMTYYDGKLIQITWQAQTGFVYDANNLSAEPIEFSYETSKFNEGWGITYDEGRDELVVTDGSGNLVFWDPLCWQTGMCSVKRTVPVTRLNGQAAFNLNEIEFWRGKIVSNVWLTDIILVIDPETGDVEKEYGEFTMMPGHT